MARAARAEMPAPVAEGCLGLCRGRCRGNTEPAAVAAAAAAVVVLCLIGRSETTGCPQTTPRPRRKDKGT